MNTDKPRMTAQERQALMMSLPKSFDTVVFDFGKAAVDSKVPFSFTYTQDPGEGFDIHAVQPGCGCTAVEVSDLVEGQRTISGVLTLDGAGSYSFDTKGESHTSKAISVYFVDGQDWFKVSDKLIRQGNPDKVHVRLTIKGLVTRRT